jgi:hypothetical protein
MDDSRPAADQTTQRLLQIQRRAKRGLIAGYIHGLSVRHNQEAVPAAPPRSAEGVARRSV